MTTVADEPRLHATACSICGTPGNATEQYPANFEVSEAFTTEVFSARRLPDRVHYRMVRCDSCGLLRSDPVLDEAVLERLYRASTFDYGDEVASLKATYGRAIGRLEAHVERRSLLDIGTGNGFVLDQALAQGWEDPVGVEPSADAIAKASPQVRDRIVEDVMRPGLFEPDRFDAVTLFQVLDHIADPVALLEECRRVLRPGGAILAFNHDERAPSARVLKARSPIVDIEHTYLYSPPTMRRLFDHAGFTGIEVGPVRNTYSLAYLLQLLPLDRGLKARLLPRARASRAGRVQVTVPLGNLCLVARAPGR